MSKGFQDRLNILRLLSTSIPSFPCFPSALPFAIFFHGRSLLFKLHLECVICQSVIGSLTATYDRGDRPSHPISVVNARVGKLIALRKTGSQPGLWHNQ